jgi:putative glycosyltransferase (TIGR04348 family)
MSAVKITLVTPAPPRSLYGNRATATRYARFLKHAGHDVSLEETWNGEATKAMISLHARRSHPSIARFAATYPERTLILVLTGTDLYRDIRADEVAKESLELATAIIVLQEKGLQELEPDHRAKAHVIYQSAEPVRRRPTKRSFDVCVIGHLRSEKDPFRASLAAKLLPAASRIRVIQAGVARDEAFEKEARALVASNPRYRWLGEVPRWRARRLLSQSRLLLQSSFIEGGANTVSEALAAHVPVIASDIPGNVGMLGEDYPGYYPVANEDALARLLYRAETDAGFYGELQKRCAARAYLARPERERDALVELVKELAGKGM